MNLIVCFVKALTCWPLNHLVINVLWFFHCYLYGTDGHGDCFNSRWIFIRHVVFRPVNWSCSFWMNLQTSSTLGFLVVFMALYWHIAVRNLTGEKWSCVCKSARPRSVLFYNSYFPWAAFLLDEDAFVNISQHSRCFHQTLLRRDVLNLWRVALHWMPDDGWIVWGSLLNEFISWNVSGQLEILRGDINQLASFFVYLYGLSRGVQSPLLDYSLLSSWTF